MKSAKGKKKPRQLRNILSIALLWVSLVVITVFGGSKFSLTVCLALPVLVGLSILSQVLVAKKRVLLLELPLGAVQKDEKIRGTLVVRNPSPVPVYAFRCVLRCQNTFTGETDYKTLYGCVASKSKLSLHFSMESAHCGYMLVTVDSFSVADLFCMAWIPAKYNACEEGTPVFPAVYSVKIAPQAQYLQSPAVAERQTEFRGQDLSGTFQLREYVSGDSLRQIHWKLTEKTDKLIVRDGVSYGREALLVFWDTLGSQENPQSADALADAVTSACCALMDSGIAFDLAWRSEKGIYKEPISRTEDCNAHILQAIRYASAPSGSVSDVDTGNSAVLYFSTRLPDDYPVLQSTGRYTFILCGDTNEKDVLSFSADGRLAEVSV